MPGAFQKGDAGQQVKGALEDVVCRPVVQPQRGDAFAGEPLGHAGIGAGTGAAEPTAGAADPDHPLVGAGSAVKYGVEVPPVGLESEAFADITVREVDAFDFPDTHQFVHRFCLVFRHGELA